MRNHNFKISTIKEIAQKSMYICANPDCLCLTGYSTTEGKPRSIAEAAHVLPSGTKGPRSEKITSYSHINLSSSANGIWLCKICHEKVDDDPDFYTPEKLFDWKSQVEKTIRRITGRDLEAALLELRNTKRFHQETRELVSFIESKRVLYQGLDAEFPPRVLDSLDMIRNRIASTRANINPESLLYTHLNTMQKIIFEFLREIGKETDLNSLQYDNNDATWRKFRDELKKLRTEIIILLKVISGDAGYNLSLI